MRWLDSITDSMHMNLSKLWESEGQWSLECAILEVAKSRTYLSDWTGKTENLKYGLGLTYAFLFQLIFVGRLSIKDGDVNCVHAKLLQSCLTLTPWTVGCQAPLSMGFSRQEYWTGLLCPPPRDLPNPGIEPASLVSPALASRFFTTGTVPPGKPSY